MPQTSSVRLRYGNVPSETPGVLECRTFARWTLLPQTFLLPTTGFRDPETRDNVCRRAPANPVCPHPHSTRHTYTVHYSLILHTNWQTSGHQEFSMHLKQADDILMFHNAGAFCCQLIIVILLLYNVPRYKRAASVISWKRLERTFPKCNDHFARPRQRPRPQAWRSTPKGETIIGHQQPSRTVLTPRLAQRRDSNSKQTAAAIATLASTAHTMIPSR